MKHFTLYHRNSGTVVNNLGVPDAAMPADYESLDFGVYEGMVDGTQQYIAAGVPADRTEWVGMSAPERATVGTAVVVTGLPDPCWLRMEGEFVAVTGGTAMRTPQRARTFYIQLAGAHRGLVTVEVLTAPGGALAEDARWQALQNATPAQIEAWLTANVTTLAEVRAVLKLLLLAVRR